MPILITICGLAALAWGAACARRVPLLVVCGLMVIVGYVLGHEFWHDRVGPIPITLDRLLLVALCAAHVMLWRVGRLRFRRLMGSDWWLAALVTILAASAVLAGPSDAHLGGEHSAWGRWLTAFLLPAALYGVARQCRVDFHEWRGLLIAMAILGTYLAWTALCEAAGQWALVFPWHIADPERGIHFGRARGPDLNAASLGMYVTACGCCAWSLLGSIRTSGRWPRLLLFVALPLFALAVLATYTRSTWLGLAVSGAVVAAFSIPRRWRWPAFAAAALAGLLIVGACWPRLMGLEREGTAAEAHHSVGQRASFAYVSWKMFQDHPLLGVGFGRFFDRKMSYLSDRSQPFELESLRSLDHHNTFLSILTETGLIGLAAFVGLLAIWSRHAWILAAGGRRGDVPCKWRRAHGILMLALVANYACSALFHDLTLVPTQHVLLFLLAAVTVNLRQGDNLAAAVRPAANAVVRSAEHVSLFGMNISRLTMAEATGRILDWCTAPRGGSCRFVVTPNVDHAVLMSRRADLQAAYRGASLVLADGAPIVLASRIAAAGTAQPRLPERVAGSDLVPNLFAAARRPLRVFLLGAAPGVAQDAANRITRTWPNAKIVGGYSPPPGFEHDYAENERILARVAAAAPDLLIVGLGAPKQELWVHRFHHRIEAKVAICAGATIDFLAGRRRRSPAWMRRAGLEWLHRAASEPRRLAGRYARDAWVFPQLLWREISQGGTSKAAAKSASFSA
jgi:N-acetylglucosaminyldiphosphoundecaprenol N-acetyl-beta-D-mannosaminyltransferase